MGWLADITAILHGTIVQPARLTSSAAQAVSLVEAALCHDEQISTAAALVLVFWGAE